MTGKGGHKKSLHSLRNTGFQKMVVGQGFEPWKAMPADLQSAPVGHLGTLPFKSNCQCPRRVKQPTTLRTEADNAPMIGGGQAKTCFRS
jgi:hypothetical protein